MRNYVKLLNLRIYFLKADGSIDPTSFHVVFGSDEDNLLANAIADMAATISPHGMRMAGFAQTIYFLLDKENVCTLINFNSGGIWSQTHLNNVFPTFVTWSTPLLYDMTAVAPEEPSPRDTWSHGH
jgi:hypothetical protein